LLLLVLATVFASGNTLAGDKVRVLVFLENGIGSAAQAQPHIDALMQVAARKAGWSGAEGKYTTRRKSANKYIDAKHPQFGIMSLGAFLALRKPRQLEIIGMADVAATGGSQYHLISKTASGVSGCKGKTLATNHAIDPRFIDTVVAAGSFKLGDFALLATRRPVQTIKKVIKGKADCALIDDAQYAELNHIDGSQGIKSVWKSGILPPMPVVSFSGATAAERAKFKATLVSLCSGAGKTTCDKVGIRSFKPADQSSYAQIIAVYGN